MLRETSGTDETWYLSGLDVLAQQQAGAWSYFGYDGLGLVRQVYGPAAAIVSATNYDPYGVPFETYTTLDSSLGFTGEFTDLNGLLFLRARYYSPQLGRFFQPDPLQGTLTSAESWNTYQYASLNPILYSDPSGRSPFLGFGAVGLLSNPLFWAGLLIIGGAILLTQVLPPLLQELVDVPCPPVRDLLREATDNDAVEQTRYRIRFEQRRSQNRPDLRPRTGPDPWGPPLPQPDPMPTPQPAHRRRLLRRRRHRLRPHRPSSSWVRETTEMQSL